MRRILQIPVLLAVIFCANLAVADDTKLWGSLRLEGHVALMRHAIAPGIGDPEEFDLDDCGTQRNLSDGGLAQAKRIGDRFRANGIETAVVFSSQWCRCRDTAELLGLGPVSALPELNSFFQRAGQRGPQTQALRQWLSSWALDRPAVLVTHQVNITALTGVYLTSGEMVIVKRAADGTLKPIGTIATD
jgi:phosphohistidine phosphatase SixA